MYRLKHWSVLNKSIWTWKRKLSTRCREIAKRNVVTSCWALLYCAVHNSCSFSLWLFFWRLIFVMAILSDWSQLELLKLQGFVCWQRILKGKPCDSCGFPRILDVFTDYYCLDMHGEAFDGMSLVDYFILKSQSFTLFKSLKKQNFEFFNNFKAFLIFLSFSIILKHFMIFLTQHVTGFQPHSRRQ